MNHSIETNSDRLEQTEAEVTTETQGDRALNGFGEPDAPEAAVSIGLHETALGAEAVKVNRAALATVDVDRRQWLKP